MTRFFRYCDGKSIDIGDIKGMYIERVDTNRLRESYSKYIIIVTTYSDRELKYCIHKEAFIPFKSIEEAQKEIARASRFINDLQSLSMV